MRTINLSCKILAPFVVGHLLEWFSYVTGAIFMACWNVISAFVEFYLLQVIFAIVPELSKRKSSNYSQQSKSTVEINRVTPEAIHQSIEKREKSAVHLPPGMLPENVERHSRNNVCCVGNGNGKEDLSNNNNDAGAGSMQPLGADFKEISLITPPKLSRANSMERNGERISTRAEGDGERKEPSGNESSKGKLCQFCHGWKIYFSHPVKYAGLGLASLYMTVLCFDNISIGKYD